MVLLIGTFSLNMSNTQAFLEKQLRSHSSDTATSLGLSLSSVADLDNPTSIQTMIDAVFDRGHFARIEFYDMDGNSVYQRTNSQINANIPDWFIQAITLSIPPSSAVVQSGWMPIGNLEVQGHKGYAYIELWQSFKQILQWFLLAALLFLATAYLAVRWLLNPLKKVEQQANAIVNKEYILQDTIPDTTEFKNLVLGMNNMVSKLEKVFEREAQVAEKLRLMAYQDTVTGLHNRHYFDMVFNRLVDENENSANGSMCLLKLNGLKALNDRYGYQLGNDFIKQIAKGFEQHLATEDGIFIRLNGIELLAVLPKQSPTQLESACQSLVALKDKTAQAFNLETVPIEICVAVMAFQPEQSRGELFTQMDFLIKQAESNPQHPVVIEHHQENEVQSVESWQTLIDNAIANQAFQLFKQSSFDAKQHIHENELLIRMQDAQGNLKSAAYFMPAVETLHRQIDIDQLVLTMVIKHLSDRPVKTLHAINLSKSLLEQPQNFAALRPYLQQASGLRLAFEFPEKALQTHLKSGLKLFSELKAFGFMVGIDRIGMHTANMQFLKQLRPDFIKLDGAFSERIENDLQTQSYVASICEMAGSLDIQVVAMSIESQQQMEAFRKAGVKYFQGYFFGTPTPL